MDNNRKIRLITDKRRETDKNKKKNVRTYKLTKRMAGRRNQEPPSTQEPTPAPASELWNTNAKANANGHEDGSAEMCGSSRYSSLVDTYDNVFAPPTSTLTSLAPDANEGVVSPRKKTSHAAKRKRGRSEWYRSLAGKGVICKLDGCEEVCDSAYSARSRVCPQHTQMQEVLIDGTYQRFCHKCTTFHPTTEFTSKKHTCALWLTRVSAKLYSKKMDMRAKKEAKTKSKTQETTVGGTAKAVVEAPGVVKASAVVEAPAVVAAPALLVSKSFGSGNSGAKKRKKEKSAMMASEALYRERTSASLAELVVEAPTRTALPMMEESANELVRLDSALVAGSDGGNIAGGNMCTLPYRRTAAAVAAEDEEFDIFDDWWLCDLNADVNGTQEHRLPIKGRHDDYAIGDFSLLDLPHVLEHSDKCGGGVFAVDDFASVVHDVNTVQRDEAIENTENRKTIPRMSSSASPDVSHYSTHPEWGTESSSKQSTFP